METNLNRWQAFGLHLLGSAVVLVVLLLILIFFWYPGVMIDLGGWQGIKIVAGVDLVLGPLLTLIVFNPAKKSLKYDLLAILLFQISCLSLGVYFVHSQSPAILVMSDEGIHVISHSELGKLSEDVSSLPDTKKMHWKPLYVLDLPTDQTASGILKGTKEVIGGKPFHYNTEMYRGFDKKNEATKNILKNFPDESDLGCRNLRLISYHGDIEVCFSDDELLLKAKTDF